jgi:poly-gamma-glutamate capsule biosynthesis protein CapA/YwtB (metallophosphatase superfamily)
MWFIGDIALNGLISIECEKNTERFKEIAAFFSSKPYVFANLETPIFVDNAQNLRKNLIHTTNEEALNVLCLLNIYGVSLANNHIYDCTEKGVRSTVKWLKNNNIKYTGAGFTQKDLDPIIFNDTEGKRVGFFAYVDEKTNPHCENTSTFLINFLNLERIKNDLIRYRGKCDKFIVSIHWGIDYCKYVSRTQIEIAEKIIDFGADLIIGHHNHVIQPYKSYKGKKIFFGLGGLVFGDYYTHKGLESTFQRTKTGLIVHYENNTFNFFKSTDGKGNKVAISEFQEYEKVGKKWFLRNLWFLKRKNFFTFYQKFQLNKMKLYHFFFSYQNNPINRLKYKLFK